MRMRSNTVVCVALALLLNLTGSFGQQDVCWQTSLNTRMFGEGDATEGFWPWLVGIYRIGANVNFCSGSLISKDWVLTSAACSSFITYAGSSDFIIYLGRLKQSEPNTHEVKRAVSDVITHPNYTSSTDNDIAMLRLSSSVDFTAHIKPICLAAAGSEFDEGLPSWVTGWGVTDSTINDLSDILQEAEIPIVSNYNCSIAYNDEGLSISITDNMMCAGLSGGEKDSCDYDDGGPLVTKQSSRWIQAGIVSLRCDSSVPSVFTRVSKYQDWINTQIVNNQPGLKTFPYYNINTLDLTSSIPDVPDVPDIFSGSSHDLHLFPFYLIFIIISLIFCPRFCRSIFGCGYFTNIYMYIHSFARHFYPKHLTTKRAFNILSMCKLELEVDQIMLLETGVSKGENEQHARLY